MNREANIPSTLSISILRDKISNNITDPRRTKYGNIKHILSDIITITFCAMICGAEDFEDVECFGKERIEWLKKELGLELPNGIPDADTIRRLFERLNPMELSNCLNDWLETERNKRSIVAIDGKTIRGSSNDQHQAYHVVSAFVTENQLTLSEITVEKKSNEITAIPKLLDLVDIQNDIVTIDAMGCQKAIAEKIIDKHADYVLALKGNQHQLHEDVKLYFESFETNLKPEVILDKGHGRVERRECRLLQDIAWLEGRSEWRGLQALGEAKSIVYEKGVERVQKRYYLTSLTDQKEFAHAVRSHWSIENQLHWSLDVTFREDASRAKKDNSPLNLNVLRKKALTLLHQARYNRMSKKRMRYKAALNPNTLLSILFGLQK